jgi:uncharacterized membrane protein YphA (DoxX/SURF4 family)
MSNKSKIIIRISMALVFMWFGLSQMFNASVWIGFVPDFALKFGDASFLVLINSIIEVSLGIMLLLGVYTRASSLILGIHLIGISLGLGYGATMIRDLGLGLVTLSIFFAGKDSLCLDNKLR